MYVFFLAEVPSRPLLRHGRGADTSRSVWHFFKIFFHTIYFQHYHFHHQQCHFYFRSSPTMHFKNPCSCRYHHYHRNNIISDEFCVLIKLLRNIFQKQCLYRRPIMTMTPSSVSSSSSTWSSEIICSILNAMSRQIGIIPKLAFLNFVRIKLHGRHDKDKRHGDATTSNY